jgi:hypothetical protein
VAKKFMYEIIEVTKKIEKLLNTNIPLMMNAENNITHRQIADSGICPLYKVKFNLRARNHDHLIGKYRGTMCNKCNLPMVKPNFVPCFFHNLSGYDAHFLITKLGFDTKSITVIPNTEEKLISFSKYVSNSF